MTEHRAECDRLFRAAAPFIRAEQEAEEAFQAAAARRKATRKAAAQARRAWADYLLIHDHQAICLPAWRAARAADPARKGEEARG